MSDSHTGIHGDTPDHVDTHDVTFAYMRTDVETALPWPRLSEDGMVQVGIDVARYHRDISRIVAKVLGQKCMLAGLPVDDLIQITALYIWIKNTSEKSAYDPRRASRSKYICMVARGKLAHWEQANARHQLVENPDEYDVDTADPFVRQTALDDWQDHCADAKPLWRRALNEREQARRDRLADSLKGKRRSSRKSVAVDEPVIEAA